MPPVKNNISPAKYLFEINAVIEILKSTDNLLKSSFIDGMKDGSVKILRSVSDDLSNAYPDEYKSFQGIKPKNSVYQQEIVKHEAVQAMLMDSYGSSILTGSPSPSYFLNVAVSIQEKLILVAAGRGLTSCRKISKKCGLSGPPIMSLGEFVTDCLL